MLAKEVHEIAGKQIDPKLATPQSNKGSGGGEERSTKVFCGGLDHSTTKEDLEAVFGQRGTVSSCPGLVVYYLAMLSVPLVKPQRKVLLENVLYIYSSEGRTNGEGNCCETVTVLHEISCGHLF